MKPADHGHCLKAVGGKRFLRQQRSSLRDRSQPVDGDRAGLPDTWCMDSNVAPFLYFAAQAGRNIA